MGFVEIGTGSSFIGASEQLRRIAARILTGGDIIQWESPCGNCSYAISFIGPAYQCQERESMPSFNFSAGTPGAAPFWYVAAGSYGYDPEVWGGPLDSQGSWIVRGFNPITSIVQCELYQAEYTSTVTYSNGNQNIITNLSFQNQIPGSVGASAMEAEFAQHLNKTAWTLFNFFAIEDAVALVLSGAITQSSSQGGYHFTSTMIGMSDLATIAPFNITYPPNFLQRVEELLVNTTLSLTYFLTTPAISQIAGYSASSPITQTTATATINTYPAQYVYSAKMLGEIYIMAIGVSMLCIAAGCYMLIRNGVGADMSFSQLLVTTRNETLDRQCYGARLGGEYIPQTLRETELKYGQSEITRFADGGVPLEGHASFGLEEEVTNLYKGR